MDFITNGDAKIRNGPRKSYWYDVPHSTMDDSHLASICNGFRRYTKFLKLYFLLLIFGKKQQLICSVQSLFIYSIWCWRSEFSYDQGCLPFCWYLPLIHSSRWSSGRGRYCFFHGTYRIFTSVLYVESDAFRFRHNKGIRLKFCFLIINNSCLKYDLKN